MVREDFPYAIIDVLVDKNSNYHISEISMSGGLTGSSMGQKEFIRRKKHILRAFCTKLDPGSNPAR